MADIAAASQEQSAGIEQVNQAVMQMDRVTQQNAALVEEAAAAAESMREQASGLTRAVAVFRISGHAQTASAGAATAEPRPSPKPVPQVPRRTERRSANRARNVERLPVSR
jgi:hypothetical protein